MSEINASRVTSQSIRCDSEKVLCVSVADEFMPASVFVNGVKFKPESDEPEILPAQIGEFLIDPLESAIRETVSMLRDERESDAGQQGIKTVVCLRLEKHLEALLAMQLQRLSAIPEPVITSAPLGMRRCLP